MTPHKSRSWSSVIAGVISRAGPASNHETQHRDSAAGGLELHRADAGRYLRLRSPYQNKSSAKC